MFTHQSRALCRKIDTSGYDLIYSNDVDILEDLEVMEVDTDVEDALLGKEFDQDFEENDDDDSEEKLEIEEKTKNPVKKYQFVYDESLCMVDKYPEINVAPGEGQRPKSVLADKNWDIKAFPQLHNLDGSNGKDAIRKVKITDQRYFMQRILNKETRFERSPAYNCRWQG